MVKRLKHKTVLIIEDDADIRNFARRVLELEGYNVLQAETGREGLRLAMESKVNLVLLDLRLPDDGGWEILEKIKGEPAISVVPVVVFTASIGEPQKERALDKGAADYLVKPLGATDLKNAVSRVLRRKK
jgi:two-component system KDP operon response regulator KdpE